MTALLALALLTHGVAPLTAAPSGSWRELEPGLEWGEFPAPFNAIGDHTVRVLRIDPKRFELSLLSASAEDKQSRTARAWAERAGAVATINASMFQLDGLTSVGLAKTSAFTNNASFVARYKAVLSWDPADPKLPPVQVLDATHGAAPLAAPDFAAKRAAYRSQVQCLRMVDAAGRNTWGKDPKHKWSTAAVGTDAQGRVLFIHVRSPYPVHDLVDALLALPLGLRATMYVEGGPEATLYVHAGDFEAEQVGSYETGFNENDANDHPWDLPNVIAVRRRHPGGAPR